MRYVALLLLVLLLPACRQTPAECTALCKRVEQWAVHCKKPVLTSGTCETYYSTNESMSSLAMHCWQMQIDWTPDLTAEFDCGKPPPTLRR